MSKGFINFDSWFEEVTFAACDIDRIVDISDKDDFKVYYDMGHEPQEALDLWLED